MSEYNPVWLLLLAIVVAAVPIVVGVSTSYLKLSIVLGMLKSGLGTQNIPGILVTMVLSIALTLFIMGPVIDSTLEIAQELDFSSLQKEIKPGTVGKFSTVLDPWKGFLKKHAGERETVFLQISVSEVTSEAAQSGEEVELKNEEVQGSEPGLRVLLLAFMLTELKEAFSMGFILLLPFLVIDLIVANVLAGMGMFMVSPVLISLPLKLLVFVVSDGWLFLSRSLILSYAG